MKFKRFNAGFTLSEVLITIGIIGIVAAMTIPSLINNTNKKEMAVRLKKMQSTIQNAVNLTMQEYGCVGDLKCTGLFSNSGDITFAIYGISQQELKNGAAPKGIARFLRISENCGAAVGCFPEGVFYRYLNNTKWSELYSRQDRVKLALQDGTLLWILVHDCNYSAGNGVLGGTVCARIGADLNGYKGPNQAGRDLFYFWITKDGSVYPTGIADDTYIYTRSDSCNTSSYGEGCAYKVLKAGKIEY